MALKHIRNLILAAGLGLTLWAVAGPAAAADTALRFGLSIGDEASEVFDLYLQHSFAPWLDRPAWRLTPYANLGFTHWSGDLAGHLGASNDRVWGLTAALGLRYEIVAWEAAHPYLAFNVGPSYISESEFLGRELGGGHYLFNLRASLGLLLGRDLRHNLSLDASHYSNAFTQRRNEGFNALGFSYGYSFW